MAHAEKKSRLKRISVWNWMGTIILCNIPVVNIIALILMIILAKSQAKRSFAIAMLILMVLAFVLTCVAFGVLGYELSEFAAQLRGGDAVNLLVSPQG